uniref:Fatty acid synthase 2 n=1 Tax=Paramormyrops kingsleyae TaxID=1676925 RepID=A0A3B3SBF3_9TELE
MGEAEQDIAVIGIGCHFPGGEGLENFWKVLLEGRNCAVEIPEERFDVRHWYDPDESKAGRSRTAKAALIDRFNEFDHKFFGITEAEADYMDPQQKLLLECSYRALEDAGIPMEKASGTRTGVFIGLMNRDFEQVIFKNTESISHYTGTGTAMSIAANRISYTFNLTGPSFAIDCACSSSLVALHSACQAIRQGDCEMALCGGVSCIMEPRVFVALSKAKMISPDGTSKPFSSRADGYGRGEGCGIVLLKPLKEALRNCDHVWGIISKTAVNQDGRSVTPITKPSMVQQEELLRRIYSAQTDPSQVQYIEAHGTGTPVGDPTEASSISKVIAKGRPPGSARLYIGSVKGNIGHTESAAGVAGLIKVLLMMHHGTIVPSVFYSEDNASIDAKALNIKIPTKAEKWEISGPAGRVAGINNFGFGGTNAHAIVRQWREPQICKSNIEDSFQLFVLSAASEKSLKMTMEDTVQKISTDNKLEVKAIAYTSACRRSHAKHKYRKVFMVSSLSELQTELKSSLNKKFLPLKSDPQLVFVFCGNGVTYRGMCKQLLKRESIFREKILEIENIFQKYNSMSILQKLESDYDNGDSSKPDVVQPLLFAIQVAICSLLKHWGVRPDAILGHSVGEVAAAHCSGLLSLEDAVKVIYIRSNLQSQVTGGKMIVASNMSVSEILKLLPAYSGKVCLAAMNSPQSCTLSGDAEAVDSLHQKLKTSKNSSSLFLHILDVPAAYHSHMMDPILAKIEKNIGTLQGKDPEMELLSTVTGKMHSKGDFTTGTYWARNIRDPVAFEQAVKSAAREKKNAVFVEIGPKRALQRNIKEILGNDTPVFSSVQPEKDHETLLTLVSKLFELGVQVDWDQFYKGWEGPPTPLPRYQFDSVKKETYLRAVQRNDDTMSTFQHPIISKTTDNGEFICNLHSEETSYLSQHKNNGVVIIPGSLYVELGLASFMAWFRPKMPLSSLQLEVGFQNPFTLSKNSPEMRVLLQPTKTGATFKVQSPLATYTSGSISQSDEGSLEEPNISVDSIFKRCKTVLKAEQIYNTLSNVGFQYSLVFKQLDNVHFGEEFKEAALAVTVPEELLGQLHDYHIHPVVLDYFLQMAAIFSRSKQGPGFPTAIGSMVISMPVQREMVIYLRRTIEGPDYYEVCGCFASKNGDVLIELKHVRIKSLGSPTNIIEKFFFENKLTAVSEDVHVNEKPRALVFADTLGVAKKLCQYLHQKSFCISIPVSYKNIDIQSLFSKPNDRINSKDYSEVLFMWGIQKLSDMKTEKVLECLVNICEIYRQLLVKLKDEKFSGGIRAVTYRLQSGSVDAISPDFVLPGLVRSCAVEYINMSIQLIDVGSVSNEDIRTLGHVIQSYPCSKYLELVINKGQINCAQVTRTVANSTFSSEKKVNSVDLEHFTLQTADAYKMSCLSAVPSARESCVEGQKVEVQLHKLCVHSSDYFSVTFSDLNFGQKIYWNKHTTQNHKLLALDFSGKVTAVGKDVRKLKVGDHIASCYPVVASSEVMIPEAVCYKTKRLPFLKEVPCVSYFVLSWEILHHALPKLKQVRKMGIFSNHPDSCLLQILVHMAKQSGWMSLIGTEFSGLVEMVNECDAFVLLPPFPASLVFKACSVSTVKHIVVVCDNEGSIPLSNNRMDNENVHIHTLHMDKVFQKAHLKQEKAKIYNWLKSMNLSSKSLKLHSTTFQTMGSGSFCYLADEETQSYFCSKTMPVIVLDDLEKAKRSNIPVPDSKKQLFQEKSVYMVAGGLTGLGFETVKFIAEKGGKFIVILSRRAPSPEMQHELREIKNQSGASLVSLQCDISVSEQVHKVVSDIELQFPSYPIRGVFHSAVVLHDGLIDVIDKSLFEKVLKPKVSGTLNLHHATRHCKLDYFVCYSSVASFIGNSAQCNYAAANSFQDSFCLYRRNLGIPGQAINWGALNLGLLSNKDHLQKFLETKGLGTMEVPDIFESLEQSLRLNNPQQVVCKFEFRNMNNFVLSQSEPQRMRFLPLVVKGLKNQEIPETRVEQDTSQTTVDQYIRSLVSEACGVDENELNVDSSLAALGIDSMSVMTIQNLIFQDRGVNIPLVKLLDPNTTLSSLVLMIQDGKEREQKSIGQHKLMDDTKF